MGERSRGLESGPFAAAIGQDLPSSERAVLLERMRAVEAERRTLTPGTTAWLAFVGLEHVAHLRTLPPTASLEADIARLKAELPKLTPVRRRGARRELEMLEAALPDYRDRDAIAATRPPGCWCLGTGGDGVAMLVTPGLPARLNHHRFCDCPDGIAARELAERAWTIEGERRRLGRISRILRQAKMERYEDWTYERYLAGVTQKLGAVPDAIAEAVDQLRAWPAADGAWLVIHGEYGSGKTTLLAIAVADWMARRAGTAALAYLTTAPDLIDRLQRTFGKNDPAEHETTGHVTDALTEVPLLAIDDLHQEYGTEWARSTYWRIVNGRYMRQRQMAFTTNLTPRQIAETYGQGFADRILENAEIVHLTGVNFRDRGGWWPR